MSWRAEELDRIGNAEELQLASRRPDGSLRPFVTIWVASAGGDIFVRSAYGYSNPWFQRALRSGQGRILAGGVERDVTFQPHPEPDAAIDASFHAKYDRFGRAMVGTVVSQEAVRATLRVLPA